MEEGGLTQEQAAEKLGKSRPAVTNLLRLLKLEDEVQGLVRSGRLSEGHARTLAGIHDGTRQGALARKAVKEGLSVRALEALVNQPVPKGKPAVKSLLPEMAEFQDRLQEALGVRAQVSGSLTKGRILLRYNSSEELEGIYEAVLRMLG
jgi:ParB family chromosome partitioning protein